MIRLAKFLFYSFAIILILSALITMLGLDKNEKFLNLFAKYYFDDKYYLANYPEVEKLNISPFEHYVSLGWKENKNPNANFNTKFYVIKHLSINKYNLNPLAHYVRCISSLKFKDIKPASVTLLKNPKYYISLVAIFQNEARFLKEWIEFYRIVGVERFYLYSHLSKDNYREVLQPYIDEGIVELREVTAVVSNKEEWNALQTSLYTKTAKELAKLTEWLIFVDSDEFLFPVNEESLQQALKKS